MTLATLPPPLEVGAYDIRFELHGPTLTSVPAPMQSDVVIAANQDTRLQPVTFAAYGRLSSPVTSMCDRLVAASWAAVTTV